MKFRRSRPTRRSAHGPRIMLTFCGSFHPQCVWTTIGDVMALYNVARCLQSHCSNLSIAWDGSLIDLTSQTVRLSDVVATDFDAVVHVCGPITDGLAPCFERFSAIQRIAVGVSIPPGCDPSLSFDAVFARDPSDSSTFDLALADIGFPHLRLPQIWRQDQIGVCLVGQQEEYGDLDGHRECENLIAQAVTGRKLVHLNTLLDNSRPIACSTELDLQCSRAIIANRMHGSLLSIFHGVPLVAVDQIRNGAKVTAMLNSIDYPVLNSWSCGPTELRDSLDAALAGKFEARASSARKALYEATECILKTVAGFHLTT